MDDTNDNPPHRGGCLCGAVRYEIAGPLRQVVSCHCSQCLRTHGHYAAYSAAARDDLSIDGAENVTWHRSSDTAQRGFCRICGSRLFWQMFDADYIAVAAGTLDTPTGLATVRHIFVDDKPDYYDLTDGLPQLPQGHDRRR